MRLEGSCHCGAVVFSVEAPHPYPFNRCYCSICRKTAGGGGYAINLGAITETLEVDGRDAIAVYHARMDDDTTGESTTSSAERHFCRRCATALWVWSPEWPALIHPFASAIDSELPRPPQRVHLLLDSRASWVEVDERPGDRCFAGYPDESLQDWHRRHGLEDA